MSRPSDDTPRGTPAQARVGAPPAHLDHLAIQSVLKVEDAKARAAKLSPYFAKRGPGNRRMVTIDDAPWGRREAYVELSMAVRLLGEVGDARAKEALQLTRRRWEGGPWGGDTLAASCKKALEAISKR
ncbi:MAG: hypothetical protein FJ290_11960 [Planctomycetes bacterium]|nr:hypothetical protein [Planctomycetota bacterium]